MSFIKSDSLFSCTKYHNYPQEIRPNDSTSNLFRSILQNIPTKPRSVLVESIFDINGQHFVENQSFTIMDRFATAGFRQNPLNNFHYNWAVCKNQGVSQEEDSEQNIPHQINQIKVETSAKEEPKSVEIVVHHHQPHSPIIQSKKVKNETKNIPKNYGKAIISFVQKHRDRIEKITQRLDVDYDMFLAELKLKKKTINTIADLRALWSKHEYAKCMRIVSYIFLRKFALPYIFDSRICTFGSHIKYRQRLCEAVSNPEDFRHIKDY